MPLRDCAQGIPASAGETTLADWLDKIRRDEEDGKGAFPLREPESDPLGIRARRGSMPDENYYLQGSQLFESCEKAREETPAEMTDAISFASKGEAGIRKEFETNRGFSIGGSGAGMAWTQAGDTLSLLMTGQKRWWTSPHSEPPVEGYRPDQSVLRWVQGSLPMLPPSFREESKMQSCTQKAGEVIYIPDGYYYSSIDISEAVSLSATTNNEK